MITSRLAKLLIVPLVGVSSLSTNFVLGQQKDEKQEGPPPAVVAVTRVTRSGEATEERFVGTSLPVRHSVIGSAVEGRVLELFYDEGDYIDAGERPPTSHSDAGEEKSIVDPPAPDETDEIEDSEERRPALVQVRTNTLNIQIRSAEAELAVAEQELALLKESLPLEIEQAKYELESAQAAFEYANGYYERQVAIQTQNPRAVSKDLVAEARSQMLAAKATLASATIRSSVLEKTKADKIEQATARANVAHAALDLLIDQRNKFSIRAPFSGYIIMQHVEVGDWISRGDPVMEIVQLDPIEVRVNVPEEFIGRLRTAMDDRSTKGELLTAKVSFEGVPGREFEGEVVRIIPQADLRSRSFPVLIHIPNPKRRSAPELQAGMLARATFGLSAKADRVFVPKDALVLKPDRYHQLVKVVETVGLKGEKELKPVFVDVQLGDSEGSLIEVRGDIEEGDRVVVEGNERIFPGQSLIIMRDESDDTRQSDIGTPSRAQ